jgi:hypothetical protein
MRQRFDVTENLENFYKILGTKYGLSFGHMYISNPINCMSAQKPKRKKTIYSSCIYILRKKHSEGFTNNDYISLLMKIKNWKLLLCSKIFCYLSLSQKRTHPFSCYLRSWGIIENTIRWVSASTAMLSITQRITPLNPIINPYHKEPDQPTIVSSLLLNYSSALVINHSATMLKGPLLCIPQRTWSANNCQFSPS